MRAQNQVTQEIYAQLACISSQQSKIRAIRDQLAAFGEAIVKQETDFGELLLVARVPAAYRHCLAECMRRSGLLSCAWAVRACSGLRHTQAPGVLLQAELLCWGQQLQGR